MKQRKYDKIADEIYDEIMDAQKYAKCAMKAKMDDRPLSETYHNLSKQEMNHAHMLIEHMPKVVMMDESLKPIWERDYDRMIDWISDVKILIDHYTEM